MQCTVFITIFVNVHYFNAISNLYIFVSVEQSVSFPLCLLRLSFRKRFSPFLMVLARGAQNSFLFERQTDVYICTVVQVPLRQVIKSNQFYYNVSNINGFIEVNRFHSIVQTFNLSYSETCLHQDRVINL